MNIPFKFFTLSVLLISSSLGVGLPNVVVENVVVFLRIGESVDVLLEFIFDMKGRLILRFLILSLFSGRCGISSSVLGLRVVDCLFW